MPYAGAKLFDLGQKIHVAVDSDEAELGHNVSLNPEWRRGDAQTRGGLGLAIWYFIVVQRGELEGRQVLRTLDRPDMAAASPRSSHE